ncbi:MAG: ADP-ribose pyrophosphatase [Labilithrix sp.]|nr:ADP-ribose pyrophosphatase [Labilithrix sp.]
MTASRATLPDAPKVELEKVAETREGEGGFLFLRRTSLRTRGSDATFPYDLVGRRAIDASVMLAHHHEAGEHHVWLRSSLRPPIGLRGDEPEGSPVLWEAPAGLVEPGESPVEAAARELAEELGFHVDQGALVPLGAASYPAPGFVGERHHFFRVVVDPRARKAPAGDGSLVEAGAEVIAIPLRAALEACRRGALPDAKTELALRRLAEVLT